MIRIQHLKFPDQTPFTDKSFSGILCSEVFHFLLHHEVVAAIWELYRLLIPGGHLFLTTVCEKAQAFEPIRLEAQQEASRESSPLFFQSVGRLIKLYEEVDNVSPQGEFYAEFMRKIRQEGVVESLPHFTLFNLAQLKEALERVGFVVVEASLGRADHYPFWTHGDQDQIRLIARRPHE